MQRLLVTLSAAAVGLLLGSGTASAVPAFFARHPALSPDGTQLAFDWRGDVWVVPAEGGEARRLTDHVAHDALPRWSPDGSEIAFASDRHGNLDVFVVGVRGGTPERLTTHSADDFPDGWSPDGRSLYFESDREALFPQIYAVPRAGGRAVRVTTDLAMNASVSPDGRWIAYVRGYNEWWRKGYRGPASFDVWVRALGGGASHLVTDWPGDDNFPQWSPDSRALFFQSEREDGTANLYRQDLRFAAAGGPADEPPGALRVEPAGAPQALTRLSRDGVRFPAVSGDGRWAAYERLGEIYVVPTGGGEPRRVAIDCPGDVKANDVTRRVLDSGATEYAFAPGEEQVAFVVEGEIYAGLIRKGELQEPIRLTETDAREKDLAWLDAKTLLFVSDREGGDDIFCLRSTDAAEPRLGKSRYREAVRLTDSPETERLPRPSPDGKAIAYLRGTRFLWTMEPDGKGQKLLLDEPQVLHFSWSPDSRYLAYSVTTLGYAEDIFILDRRGDYQPVNVSNHPNDDFHPLWSGDGQRLSWASRTEEGLYHVRYLWLTRAEADKSVAQREREEEAAEDDSTGQDDPKPVPEVKIDWDDVPDRIRTVTTVRGYYWDYDASPDGKHYALRTDAVEQMELWTVDWDGDHLRRMTRGGADPDRMLWAEDNRRVRYLSGGQIREIKNEEGAEPKTLGFSVELTVDALARRVQKLNEAWRLMNDGFYDERFHGVDWAAMREKYAPLARAAVMHEDLSDVLRMMIGELNASHLGVYGPWRGGGDETGLLGFTPDDGHTGPGVGVGAVLPLGPLDREGRRVAPGEVILAIDGREIGAGADYHALLNHKVGKEVDLTVADGGEKRRVTVEPVGGGRIWELTYKNWTEENRRLVDRISGGRLGYVHMSAMGDGNWDRFIEDVFSKARGKAGLILDVRNNNGGSIHDRVLTFLSRRPYVYSRNRGGREVTYDAMWRWDGPIVLLTNERSYSDGEIFPAGFQALGLGRVVGMPTFGAVIGTNDVRLIDGTGFRVPGTGWFRMDGVNLENHPVEPDVRVPDVPEEAARGQDAQIEAAVRECLGMIGSVR
jgi:tricorn protease